MVCVTVVAGIGETDLLLHLLTSVAPFKEVGTVQNLKFLFLIFPLFLEGGGKCFLSAALRV